MPGFTDMPDFAYDDGEPIPETEFVALEAQNED
jgi:hypothetical protein